MNVKKLKNISCFFLNNNLDFFSLKLERTYYKIQTIYIKVIIVYRWRQ